VAEDVERVSVMSDTSSNHTTSMEPRVTKAGEAIGEHGKTATVATASAERSLMVALVGFALGYLASLWIHAGGGRPARISDDKANAKVPSP
jgi:hypothetical protein